MPKPIPTAERVRGLLDYDQITGVFTWKISTRSKGRAGAIAGHREARSIRIGISGVRHQAHRLAWLWMTGVWPDDNIDHKDRNPFNNSWSNLRICNESQNAANVAARRTNKCGLKGAYLHQSGKWSASIKKDGRSRNLGYFPSKEEAHAAYCTAASDLFGEFARAA